MTLKQKITEMANKNIGSLCLFLKNEKNKEYLQEILKNIPKDIENKIISEKITYYVFDIKDKKLCGCGKDRKFIGFKNGWRETCGSINCVKSKRKKTCIENFGVDNPKKSKEIINKEQERILEKLGTHYMNNKSIQDKFNDTMVSKYNVNWAQQSKKISNKSKETWKNNPNKNEIIQKRKEKILELYTESKEEINQKKEKTIIKNWRTKENLYNHINLKIKEKSLKNWGKNHHLSSKDIIKKRIETYQDNITKKIINKLPDNINYISRKNNINNTDSVIKILCKDCNKESNINRQYLDIRIKNNINPCLNCFPILSGKSNSELDVLELIKKNYDGEILSNVKNIIDGYELDIYLPELKIAIEFNGLYWHSEEYKSKRYHLDKTKLCLDNEIFLIHIWEDDWKYKNNIVKSIILNKLGKSISIGARKCFLKEIYDNKEIRDFLDKNHIQGFVGSSHKIGLYYNDELVSLMTFGKKRKVMNQKSNTNEYELIRFCNKLGLSVIGGASRLFNFFVKKYSPDKIISYSDSSRSVGRLYEKLGFKLVSDTDPNYYWIVDGIRKHRFNFRKDILVSEGFDKNKTEVEIMTELGYKRIFDCGSKKWIYLN